MSDSEALGLVFAVFGVLIAIRNQLVYKASRRRIEEIHAACERDIRRADFIPLMEARYGELDSRSYGLMLLDLRCWTYRQFFPTEVA